MNNCIDFIIVIIFTVLGFLKCVSVLFLKLWFTLFYLLICACNYDLQSFEFKSTPLYGAIFSAAFHWTSESTFRAMFVSSDYLMCHRSLSIFNICYNVLYVMWLCGVIIEESAVSLPNVSVLFYPILSYPSCLIHSYLLSVPIRS
jgi:hypothetical protein